MSQEQSRRINEQQAALRRSERTIQQLHRELMNLSEVARTAISQIGTGYPHCAANQLRRALLADGVSQMTVITDGLVTEADRLALITAVIESMNPATTHELVRLALKLGVTREDLTEAAEHVDHCALGGTVDGCVSDRVKGALNECA